ncbi:MAG: hypothetical protein A3F70_09880 [Acidobacteria bacterium RIFCSPLOWO2_12_FULL_67_14]|nr:MAG: hypothetical protein A3H29_00090 [Acidobacteria bacterium RIFCSPLOWO2_02_FULL_67_21]OFW38060.1 MAG: hypothetical protein A3F70_09880 [Acidobacteria bacterium RIFCSPLOWO2_12_FULL_67_14]
MRRVIHLLLVIVIVFVVRACGPDNNPLSTFGYSVATRTGLVAAVRVIRDDAAPQMARALRPVWNGLYNGIWSVLTTAVDSFADSPARLGRRMVAVLDGTAAATRRVLVGTPRDGRAQPNNGSEDQKAGPR